MKVINFPWEHHVNEETKEVWVHIPGGYPTVLGMPYAITKAYPGYKGHLCTYEYLLTLQNNEQKESS